MVFRMAKVSVYPLAPASLSARDCASSSKVEREGRRVLVSQDARTDLTNRAQD